jgi:uncharacterized membrane protein
MSAPAAPRPDPVPTSELPDSAYRLMATTLRAGLAIALAVLAAAAIALIAVRPGSSAGAWVSANPLVGLLDLSALGRGLAAGRPEAYLTVGVFALIATPVVRVVTGVYSFYRLREPGMVALSAAVLLLLLFGLLVLGPLVR